MISLQDQFKTHAFGIIPLVTFKLEPQAAIVAHPGTLLMKDPAVEMSVRLFNSNEKQLSPMKRMMRGMSKAFVGQFVSALFTNHAADTRNITLHPEHGGSVVWIDLDQYGGAIKCKRHGFLASTNPDIHLGISKITTTAWQTLTSDQEVFLERVESKAKGTDHHVFLSSKSAAIEVILTDGETLDLHSNALLAATDNVDISLRLIPGFVNRRAGEEGSRYTVVKGPGTIWLQASNPAAMQHGGASNILDIASNLAPM